MENLLLTLQHQGNDEVPLNHQNDEVNEGDNESLTLTKKDVDDILAKQEKRIHSRNMDQATIFLMDGLSPVLYKVQTAYSPNIHGERFS